MEKPPLPKGLVFLAAGLAAAMAAQQFVPAAQRDLLLQWGLMLWLALLVFAFAGFQWALWLNAGLCVCAFLACAAGLVAALAGGSMAPHALVLGLGGMVVSGFYAWYMLQNRQLKAWSAYMRQLREGPRRG